MAGRVRNRKGQDAQRSPLFLPVAVVLAVWVLFGGSAPESILQFGMLALSGSALVVLVIAHNGFASWGTLAWPARLAILFFCLMPLLQLVPLPPAMWSALPGRTLAENTLGAVGLANKWHPLTLAVAPTFRTLLVFIWLAALLLALLQLPSDEMRRVFGLLLVLGLLNVAVGIVQIGSGHRLLGFYRSDFLNGLFANKNHTGLFIALTFLFGYAFLYARQGWDRRHLGLVIPASLVLLASLLATFSRAGVVFGVAAIAFLAVLSSGQRQQKGTRYLAIGVPVTLALLVAVIGSSDVASRAMARFEAVGEDLRWLIWGWSWPLVTTYFPAGSGIGSFTSVFPPSERLGWVKPTFVNNAHNDFLEQLIEVGIAAPVCWALVVAAVWQPIGIAWSERTRQSGRLALIGAATLVLILVHSAFDYPLRRPAIAATAMVALAALLRIGDRERRLRAAAGYARQDP